eukprot:364246-Chlamydomonas_euryale.AAC.5
MPVLSAAREGIKHGLGAVTNGTPVRTVLSGLIPASPPQPDREHWAQSCNSPIPVHGAWYVDHSTQARVCT